MATRARIGIQNEDGTITASYQHWDGYPGGLGYNLVDYWTDANKVREAIALGNASKWGFIIGTKVDFDDRNDPLHEVQNVYYMRDRGEKDQGPTTYKDASIRLSHRASACSAGSSSSTWAKSSNCHPLAVIRISMVRR